jgi:hypothetical protein
VKLSNDGAADTVAHFQAGFEVIKRYPVMAVPTLAAQILVFGLTVLFLGGAVAAMVVAGGAGLLGAILGGFLLWLVSGLLTLAASAVTIVMARDALDGREPSVGDGVAAIMARLGDVVGASALFGLIVVVASIFFVIPGLIAAFFLMFALPAVLLDGVGALDALGRSARLVRANLGPALGLVVGVIVIMIALWIALAILSNVPLLGQLASAVLLGVFAAYVAVVVVRVYRLLPVR